MTGVADHVRVRHALFDPPGSNPDNGPACQVTVCAGHRGTDRIVPPAGEAHAFEVQRWARTVIVSVSPTGRRVRVWVDGQEVPARG